MVRARRPRSVPRQLRRALAAVGLTLVGIGTSAGLIVPAAAQADAAQGRIVGGSTTTIRQVPWQVSVWSRGGEDGGFDCGGSIISETTVVTAAHCVEGVDFTKSPETGGLGIYAGISHLDFDLPGDGYQTSTVVSARIHPEWNPDRVQTAGDLAVLKLSPPLALDGVTAKAIALPPLDQPVGEEPLYVGMPALVSGYGRQQSGEQPSGQLFALDTYVDSPSTCETYDNAVALCVRSPSGAACSGDSGGPLVSKTTPPVLIGVVSNGPAGCPAGEGDNYVNLGVPENRRFLDGAATPPIAPRQTLDLTFAATSGRVLSGENLLCGAGFTGNPVTHWAIKSDTGATLSRGTGGSTMTYRPSDGDAGHVLSCEVRAVNDGGVAVAGPVYTSSPVRIASKDAPRPSPVAFRLGEATLGATSSKTVKRGKVVRVDVTISSLSGADSGTICVKQGTAKPKCLSPSLKNLATSRLAFRFRISKRAKVKSLEKFAVTAALAGRNPNSGLVEQVSRAASVRVRVSR